MRGRLSVISRSESSPREAVQVAARRKVVLRLVAAGAAATALSIAVVHSAAGAGGTVRVAAAAATGGTAKVPSTTTTSLTLSQAVCDSLGAFVDDLRRISVSLTDPPNLKPALDRAVTSLVQSQDLSSHVSSTDPPGTARCAR